MQKAKNEKILNVVNIVLIILLSITFILPVFYIISASLSTSASFARYGYTLIPKTIDFTRINTCCSPTNCSCVPFGTLYSLRS